MDPSAPSAVFVDGLPVPMVPVPHVATAVDAALGDAFAASRIVVAHAARGFGLSTALVVVANDADASGDFAAVYFAPCGDVGVVAEHAFGDGDGKATAVVADRCEAHAAAGRVLCFVFDNVAPADVVPLAAAIPAPHAVVIGVAAVLPAALSDPLASLGASVVAVPRLSIDDASAVVAAHMAVDYKGDAPSASAENVHSVAGAAMGSAAAAAAIGAAIFSDDGLAAALADPAAIIAVAARIVPPSSRTYQLPERALLVFLIMAGGLGSPAGTAPDKNTPLVVPAAIALASVLLSASLSDVYDAFRTLVAAGLFTTGMADTNGRIAGVVITPDERAAARAAVAAHPAAAALGATLAVVLPAAGIGGAPRLRGAFASAFADVNALNAVLSVMTTADLRRRAGFHKAMWDVAAGAAAMQTLAEIVAAAPDVSPDTRARAYNTLSHSLRVTGDLVGADAAMKAAIDVADASPTVRLNNIFNHGVVKWNLGDIDAALACYGTRDDDATIGARSMIQNTNNAALAHAARGEYELAIALLVRTLSMRMAMCGPASPEASASAYDLARTFLASGRIDEARSAFEIAVNGWRDRTPSLSVAAVAEREPNAVWARKSPGASSDFDFALDAHVLFLAFNPEAAEQDSFWASDIIYHIGIAHEANGDVAAAAAAYDAALAIRAALPAPSPAVLSIIKDRVAALPSSTRPTIAIPDSPTAAPLFSPSAGA